MSDLPKWIFFTKNPNLKKKDLFGSGGGGKGARESEKIGGGGGWGGEMAVGWLLGGGGWTK